MKEFLDFLRSKENLTFPMILQAFEGKKGGNIAYGVGKKSHLSNYQCTVNHLSNMCELFVSMQD